MFHQFKTDLRCDARILAAWLGILAAHILVNGAGVIEDAPGMLIRSDVGKAQGFLWLAAALIPVFLTALPILRDAATDRDGFWLTRPIRERSLLGAKLLYVGTFCVALPLAADLAILLMRGAGAKAWFYLPPFAAYRLLPVAGAFFVASLSPGWTRFLFGTFAALAIGFLTYRILGIPFLFGEPTEVVNAINLRLGIAASAGFAAFGIWQMLDRRALKNAALATAALPALALAATLLPADAVRRSEIPADEAPKLVNYGWEQATVNGVETLQPNLWVEFPPETSAVLLGMSGEIGGEPLRQRHQRMAPFHWRRVARLLGGEIVSAEGKDPEHMDHFLKEKIWVNPDFDVPFDAPVHMDGLSLRLGHIEQRIAGRLPLQSGAEWRENGNRIRLRDASVDEQLLQIVIEGEQLQLSADPGYLPPGKNASSQERALAPFAIAIRYLPTGKFAIVLGEGSLFFQSEGFLSPFARTLRSASLSLSELGLPDGSGGDLLAQLELIVIANDFLGVQELPQPAIALPPRAGFAPQH
ncbi:MAG: hypothetical protein R3F11_04110 [Verrucomicrobiales bacterium]